MVRGEMDAVVSPSPTEKVDLTLFLKRSRTYSRNSSGFYDDTIEEEDDDDGDGTDLPNQRKRSSETCACSPGITTDKIRLMTARMHFRSESSDDSGADTITEVRAGNNQGNIGH